MSSFRSKSSTCLLAAAPFADEPPPVRIESAEQQGQFPNAHVALEHALEDAAGRDGEGRSHDRQRAQREAGIAGGRFRKGVQESRLELGVLDGEIRHGRVVGQDRSEEPVEVALVGLQGEIDLEPAAFFFVLLLLSLLSIIVVVVFGIDGLQLVHVVREDAVRRTRLPLGGVPPLLGQVGVVQFNVEDVPAPSELRHEDSKDAGKVPAVLLLPDRVADHCRGAAEVHAQLLDPEPSRRHVVESLQNAHLAAEIPVAAAPWCLQFFVDVLHVVEFVFFVVVVVSSSILFVGSNVLDVPAIFVALDYADRFGFVIFGISQRRQPHGAPLCRGVVRSGGGSVVAAGAGACAAAIAVRRQRHLLLAVTHASLALDRTTLLIHSYLLLSVAEANPIASEGTRRAARDGRTIAAKQRCDGEVGSDRIFRLPS
jgi:hypothetical protein